MELNQPLQLTGSETENELRQLKQGLYQAAKDAGILSGLATVARYLGENLSAKYGPKYRCESNGVSIYRDDYGNFMTVHFNGKLVASTHPTEQVFVPGTWLDLISPLIPEAEAKKQELEMKRELSRRSQLAAQMVA